MNYEIWDVLINVELISTYFPTHVHVLCYTNININISYCNCWQRVLSWTGGGDMIRSRETIAGKDVCYRLAALHTKCPLLLWAIIFQVKIVTR